MNGFLIKMTCANCLKAHKSRELRACNIQVQCRRDTIYINNLIDLDYLLVYINCMTFNQ